MRGVPGWLLVLVAAGCGFTGPVPAVLDDGGVDAALPPAVVGFAATMSTEDEMSGAIQVEVTLSRPATQTVTVPYRIVPNTGVEWATPDVDFSATDGTLTFNPGDQLQGIALTIIGDSLDEENENIGLELLEPTGDATLGAMATHTITISKFVLPRVRFTVSAANGDEATAGVQLGLTVTTAATSDITVGYTVTGTASNTGTYIDHSLVAGMLMIPAGMTTATIPVTITNDVYDEPNENISVTLSSSINAVIDSVNPTHVYTINDNDAPPTLTFAAASVAVSQNEATTDVTLVAQISERSELPISATFAQNTGVANSATAATDFSYTTIGPLTWGAGTTALSKNIVVHIIDDPTDEVNEIVETIFGSPINTTIPANTRSTLTITNIDAPSQASFDASTPNLGEIAETDADHNHDFRVLLDKPSAKSIQIAVNVTGTATGSDFTIRAGDIPLMFSPGQTMKTIRVTVEGDTTPENGSEDKETVILTLANPMNATIGTDNVRQFTIDDDD